MYALQALYETQSPPDRVLSSVRALVRRMPGTESAMPAYISRDLLATTNENGTRLPMRTRNAGPFSIAIELEGRHAWYAQRQVGLPETTVGWHDITDNHLLQAAIRNAVVHQDVAAALRPAGQKPMRPNDIFTPRWRRAFWRACDDFWQPAGMADHRTTRPGEGSNRRMWRRRRCRTYSLSRRG